MQGILAAVLLMAVVTYIPRAFPMVFLRRKLKSEFLRSFLYYVPYAVLGAMIFPKIVYSTGNIYTALAGMIAALIMAYFNKGLMKVAISAILVVYISGLLFKLA
ncbi:MAG TPA: AzlD domain-containing protein [Clostridiales bacterium]|nr:AzlD domain-containing protein [Clostridiales bacterium]